MLREQGGQLITTIERHWAQFSVPKKQNKNLSTNIARWAESPKQPFFPRKWRGRGHRAFKDFIKVEEDKEKKRAGSGEFRVSEMITRLRDMKSPTTLPLSGHKISRDDEDGDAAKWFLRAKSFGEDNDSDFPQIRAFYPVLNRKLQVHRNIEKGYDPPPMSWSELLLYTQGANLIHNISENIGTDLLKRNPSDRKSLSGEVDSEVLQCLLSLETLHAGPVLEALVNVFRRIGNVALAFGELARPVFDGNLHPLERQSRELGKSAKRLVEMIEEDMQIIALSSPTNPLPMYKCARISNAICGLEEASKNHLGRLILHGPQIHDELNVFRSLGCLPKDIVRDSDSFSILQNRLSEFLSGSTTLYKDFCPENEFHSDISDGFSTVQPSSETIRLDLLEADSSDGKSWTDEYEEIEGSFRQIGSVLTRDDGDKAEASKFVNELKSLRENLKNPDSDFDGVVDALRKPPNHYNRHYQQMADRAGYETLTSSAINDLEGFLSRDKRKVLLEVLTDDLELSSDQIMDNFQGLLDKSIKVREDYRKANRELRQVAGVSAQPMSRLAKILKDSKKKINGEFRKGFVDLRRLDSSGKETEKGVRKFVDRITASLDRMDEACEEILIGPSGGGGTGTLLIGLGQGGQQILRAMIANLMNTTHDERSNNVLRSLGMGSEEIERVGKLMVKFQYKMEKLDEDNNPLEYGDLQGIFDSCNVLAVNLGREIKELLDQSYSFIWGSRSSEISSNRRVERLSSNLLLLDPEGKGAGGKLGKGRAFADESKGDINQTLHGYKSRQRRITHVAIIHSFAGGSGSGMILPMLTEVKLQFPAADVWTFSAGPGTDDTAKFASHNVTYITSDILQSHYNALHHKLERIGSEKWDRFRDSTKRFQDAMSEQWKETISEWMSKEAKALGKDGGKSTIFNRDFNDKVGEKGMHGFSRRTDGIDGWDWHSCLPNSDVDASLFAEAIRDNELGDGMWKTWQSWVRAAGDPMQRVLGGIVGNERPLSDSEETQGYSITRTQIRQLERYYERIEDWINAGKDPEVEFAKSQKGGRDKLVEFALKNERGPDSEEDGYDNSTLRNALRAYSDNLTNYQTQVEDMGEIILMNRGAKNDNKIKHFIVSNSHLDSSAGMLTDEVLYEIYNSTMVDTLVNIIHSLVQDMNISKDASVAYGSDSVARDSTAQIMDISDMRGRTKPIASAMSLDLSISSEVSFHARYHPDTAKQVDIGENESLKFEAFQNLFISRESPLFDEVLDIDLETQGEHLRALCYNLFADDDLLRISPEAAVDMIGELGSKWPEELSLGKEREEKAKRMYDNLAEKRARGELEKFSVDDFYNMIRWIFTIPLEIIKGYLAHSVNEENIGGFEDSAKSWKHGHEIVCGEKGAFTGAFSIKGRKVALGNSIAKFLLESGVTSDEKDGLTELFTRLGILDESHLAIIPSAFLNDTAAWALLDNIKISKDSISKSDLLNEVGSPSGSIELSIVRAKQLKAHEVLKDEELQKALTKSNAFLRVKELRGVNLVATTTRFSELTARMKHSVSELYPDIASYSLVDLLIARGSNPHNLESVERGRSERPEFRLVRKELSRMALVRKTYRDEPISVTVLRNCLLGRPLGELNEAEKEIRKIHLKDYADNSLDEFFENVQAEGEGLKFGKKEFTPPKFQKSIGLRLNRVGENSTLLEGFEVSDLKKPQSHQILIYVAKVFDKIRKDESDDSEEFNLRETLGEICQIIKFIGDEELKEDLIEGFGFDLSEIRRELTQVRILLNQIVNLYFQGERQYQFLNGQLGAGKGVAFPFDGTVDATRTVSDNYLAILNHTIGLPTTLIERSIAFYFQDFLEQEHGQDKTAVGQFFSQMLDDGPLAHLTLIQQGSGPIELSASFSNLIRSMGKKSAIPFVADSLIHPFSFIKNLLWLSTFRGVWLQGKIVPQYAEVFDIGIGQIESIYSEPKRVQQGINSVRQDNDLAGHALPSMDTEAWNDLGLLRKSIVEKDEEIAAALARKQYQLTDLMLMNYARCKALSENPSNPKAAERKAGNLMDSPDPEMERVYPRVLWGSRLSRRNFQASELYYPDETVKSVGPKPGSKLGGLLKSKAPASDDGPGAKYESEANAWIGALENWKIFIEKKYRGSSVSLDSVSESEE